MSSTQTSGSYKDTEAWLRRIAKLDISALCHRIGALGVSQLAARTPYRTGLTANSWNYRVDIGRRNGRISIVWWNTNINDGTPIAWLIQTGHATGTGGFVPGIDYINPALIPVFNAFVEEMTREVIS